MSDTSDRHYEGAENLESMAEAVNYNRYLADLVVADAGGRTPVLDFGAGTGLLAGLVAEAGLNVICVEPDPSFRNRLRQRSFAAHPELDALAADSVPYIYSFNVLEHIEDDVAACRAVYRTLAPGGRFLVYVPAFQVLYGAMDRKVGHHRRYTRGSLVSLLRQAGFAVRHAQYADSLGYLASLVYKWFGSSSGIVEKSSVALYDRHVFPASRRLDRLCRRFVGKNVFALAHKPGHSTTNCPRSTTDGR